jgi:hypothetical protein
LTSLGRKAVAATVFGLMFVALALVLGSGAGPFSSDDDVDTAMLVSGLAAFGLAGLIALVVRAVRPEWRRDNAYGPKGNVALWGGLLVALLIGIAVDFAR